MSNNLFKKFKIFTSTTKEGGGGGGGSSIWGTITGFLSNQTDLQNALDAKVDENPPITGATKTKVTYDNKGLVTGGADAKTADIDPSTDRNYVTDAELVVIQEVAALHSGSVNIDFGNDGVLSDNDLVINTVLAPWITVNSKIVCFVENDGVDHTDEDVYIENIIATVYNIVPNVSFDIIAVAHNLTWGRYKITYKEII